MSEESAKPEEAVSEDAAPGWDAIDARLRELYPDTPPKHFGTVLSFALGGEDPLDGISFYERVEPRPHWHIVSYGMSELYTKESEIPDESGWGFEFTFRVARQPDETEPPIWAANLLQNLARYVYSSGNVINPGDHMNANGPICLDRPTLLTALAYTEDPELGPIETPHGRLRFLQVVGLTEDEYAGARRWNTEGVLSLLAEQQPLLITDLDRSSILDDPAALATVDAGQANFGSSTALLEIAGFTWAAEPGKIALTFAAITAPTVAQSVKDRLQHGRSLVLHGGAEPVILQPGEVFATRLEGGSLQVDLPLEAIAALPEALVDGADPVPGTSLKVEIAA